MLDIYDLMVKQLKIRSILDLKIKWYRCLDWLSYFSWVSKSFQDISDYLRKRGLSSYE